MATEKVYYCEKCGRTMTGDNFYTSNNLEKYPDDGKLPQCKKSITMHVDNIYGFYRKQMCLIFQNNGISYYKLMAKKAQRSLA